MFHHYLTFSILLLLPLISAIPILDNSTALDTAVAATEIANLHGVSCEYAPYQLVIANSWKTQIRLRCSVVPEGVELRALWVDGKGETEWIHNTFLNSGADRAYTEKPPAIKIEYRMREDDSRGPCAVSYGPWVDERDRYLMTLHCTRVSSEVKVRATAVFRTATDVSTSWYVGPVDEAFTDKTWVSAWNIQKQDVRLEWAWK